MAMRGTTTTPTRKGTTTTGSTTTTTVSELDVYRGCANTCYETFNYCVQKGGDHVDPEHLKALVDCAELCNVTANFIARESDVAETLLDACAEACKNCEESCENFEDDRTMENCANICRACYEHSSQ